MSLRDFLGHPRKATAVRVSGMEKAQWLVVLRVAGEIRKGSMSIILEQDIRQHA